MAKKPVDRKMLVTIVALTVFGFVLFVSATFGLLARNSISVQSIILNQLFFGVILGSLAAFLASRLPIIFLRRYGIWFFLLSLLMTAIVFIPGIGVTINGATRWIHIGPLSIQPSELLKISYILFYATWLVAYKKELRTWKFGLVPYVTITGLCGILLLQPDTDTFLVIAATGFVMYFIAGMSWKHFGILVLAGIIGLAGIVAVRPYIYERILTFINPASDALNSGYQVQQSLIAIGSGGITGKGFGQSVQKFNFLPEPTSDSIFAVAAEEFGFVGATIIIFLFTFLALRASKILTLTKDNYSRYILIGIITMIIVQAFMNIASMLGLFPLSGLPLLFVSHGGTALLMTLFASGILLGISRNVIQKA
jgi:cell division protein FtsW